MSINEYGFLSNKLEILVSFPSWFLITIVNKIIFYYKYRK